MGQIIDLTSQMKSFNDSVKGKTNEEIISLLSKYGELSRIESIGSEDTPYFRFRSKLNRETIFCIEDGQLHLAHNHL